MYVLESRLVMLLGTKLGGGDAGVVMSACLRTGV